MVLNLFWKILKAASLNFPWAAGSPSKKSSRIFFVPGDNFAGDPPSVWSEPGGCPNALTRCHLSAMRDLWSANSSCPSVKANCSSTWGFHSEIWDALAKWFWFCSGQFVLLNLLKLMWFLVLIHIGSNNQRNCNGTGTPTPLKSNMNKFLNFELRDFVLQELLYCNLVATFCARTCCFRFKSSCSNASSPFRFFGGVTSSGLLLPPLPLPPLPFLVVFALPFLLPPAIVKGWPPGSEGIAWKWFIPHMVQRGAGMAAWQWLMTHDDKINWNSKSLDVFC